MPFVASVVVCLSLSLQLIAASCYNVAFCSILVVPLMFFLGSSSEFLVGRLVLAGLMILWCSAFNVAALMLPKLALLLGLSSAGLVMDNVNTGLPTLNSGQKSGSARSASHGTLNL